MMRFSFAFLGLLFFSAAAAEKASRGRGLRQEADTLEASMTKLYKALNDERIRPSESKDSRFSELLAEVEKKHKQSAESELVDAMKEVIENLAEAREEKDDMGAVLSHLKSAVSKMNSIAVEKNKHRGLQEDASALENGAEPVTSAADFRQAMQCAATAARVNDIGAFLSCTQTIKQGVQAAILKVKNALDTIPSGELEELLAKRLSEANQDVAAVEDPVATASVAAATIGQLLDDSVSSLGVVGDFLMLLWIVPLSVVWGTVLWLFIGVWVYGPEYGILGSLWFEISWLLSGFGCLFTIESVCGIWTP